MINTINGDKRNYNTILEASGSTLSGTTEYSGLIVQMRLGENASKGDLMYIDSTGKIKNSDASSSSTLPAFAIMCDDGYTDNLQFVLLQGFMLNTSWSWTTGSILYASLTTGELTETKPTSTGDYVQVIGIATSSTTIYFKPDLTYIQN